MTHEQSCPVSDTPFTSSGLTSSAKGLVGIGTGRGVGSAAAPGSFGELLQGELPGGTGFLVTLPIERGSRARFRLDPADSHVRVRPPHKAKSSQLARAMLTRYGVAAGGLLVIDSDLPEGKGLASSTADLVASARAVARAIGVALHVTVIESLLRQIEPSDGVMYDDVVAFHHRDVRLGARLGHLSPLTIVGIDEGGEVRTVDFNRLPMAYSAAEQRTYAQLLSALSAAVRRIDVETIGAVATRSAELNQRACPKRTLDEMSAICAETGALGVVAAHSGTVLGILLDDDRPGHDRRLERVLVACRNASQTVWVDHSRTGDTCPVRPSADWAVSRRPALILRGDSAPEGNRERHRPE